MVLNAWLVSNAAVGPTGSRFGDDQRVSFQLSAVEDARTLDAPFVRVGNILLTLSESDRHSEASALLHLFLLHLRHALRGEVEPLSRTQYSVLRLAVRDWCLKSLLDQSIS